MKYCCKDFLSSVEYEAISRTQYPSGIEYYIDIKVQGTYKGIRVYYCPYCGKDLG